MSCSGGRWCRRAPYSARCRRHPYQVRYCSLLAGVNALGVDEDVWSTLARRIRHGHGALVNHIRDAHGMVRARLLDFVPGRSGKATPDWLKGQGAGFTAGIKTAAPDRSAVTLAWNSASMMGGCSP